MNPQPLAAVGDSDVSGVFQYCTAEVYPHLNKGLKPLAWGACNTSYTSAAKYYQFTTTMERTE